MVYVLKSSQLNAEEFALAVSLQGIVNQHHKEIYIDIDNYMFYLNEEFQFIDLWYLVKHYIQLNIVSGLCVFDFSEDDISINMAANLSATEHLLSVPRSLLRYFDVYQTPVKMDLSNVTGSNASRQRQIFNRVKNQLNRNGLIHQVVAPGEMHLQLRDFAISEKMFVFFTSNNKEDLHFRHEILSWANRNIPIYGWTQDEISFVKDISSYGNYIIPMDWSSNHSYFGISEPTDIIYQKRDEPVNETEQYHYLTIVVSDGDNIQWLERDFAFSSNFGQRLQTKCVYPMTWTISPSMVYLCPEILKKIYEKAKNDQFISGVSGIGYANLMEYPYEHLREFTNQTKKAMNDSNLKVICMLDNMKNLNDDVEIKRRLDFLANDSTIQGGIWEIDPDRYESGKGKIFYSSNHKPFVSVRFSLWHPTNQADNVTFEWLDQYADAINQMPISPSTSEGYSVLNIHPWTTNMENLDYLVSKLDKHIKIVFAEDFIKLIKQNVISQ